MDTVQHDRRQTVVERTPDRRCPTTLANRLRVIARGQLPCLSDNETLMQAATELERVQTIEAVVAVGRPEDLQFVYGTKRAINEVLSLLARVGAKDPQ